MKTDAVDGRNTNCAADDLLHFHQLAHELFVDVENFLRRVVDSSAFTGQLELLLTAIDEQGTEVLFHRPSLLAYGGLSNSVEAGGF